MKIGIIGTGNMGSLLIRSFIKSGAVNAHQLTICNRTKQKALQLQSDFPGLVVVSQAQDVIENSDLVFICIKPLDIPPLLEKVKFKWKSDQLAISITSPISVNALKLMIPSAHVARAIPSITNQALSGTTLVTFHEQCKEPLRDKLWALLEKISTPVLIEENVTRISSDIASCGPAFFSYLLQKFIDDAVKQTSISEELATILAVEMIIGMGKLLEEGDFTLESLKETVCVKGGITGIGIECLESELNDTFALLFNKTHEKFAEDQKLIRQHLSKK